MGFHWTPCKGGFTGVSALTALILCAILVKEQTVVIRTVEWCCGFLALGSVLSAVLYPIMYRLLMPHTIYIRGEKHIGFIPVTEARNGKLHRINNNKRGSSYSTYTVPLLFRSADEGEEGTTGKFDIPSWRN